MQPDEPARGVPRRAGGGWAGGWLGGRVAGRAGGWVGGWLGGWSSQIIQPIWPSRAKCGNIPLYCFEAVII